LSVLFDHPGFSAALDGITCSILGDQISALAEEIAEITIWAIEEYEKLPGERIIELIEDESRRAAMQIAIRVDSRQTDQRGALKQIDTALIQRVPTTIGFGGPSGVGKSTVLRRAAHAAARRFLEARASFTAPPLLPIMINLSRVVELGDRRVPLGAVIFRWWTGFSNSLRAAYCRRHGRTPPKKDITFDDLILLNKRYELVGILDSADEFLEHHQRFDQTDLTEWISGTPGDGLYGSRPFAQIVIARRCNEEAVDAISQTCQKDIFCGVSRTKRPNSSYRKTSGKASHHC
jgi:hypothetical protein